MTWFRQRPCRTVLDSRSVSLRQPSQLQREGFGIAILAGDRVIDATQAAQLGVVDRVVAVGRAAGLRGAAGADDREGSQGRILEMIEAVAMAVQPKADAAGGG